MKEYYKAMIGAALAFSNPYADLPEISRNSEPLPSRKLELTKKQKANRAATKRAKKARKKNRK